MGIRTRLSTNPAMVLGGLKEGVTPLEMAYAYSTIANHGKRVSGSFAASKFGPVAFTKVQIGDRTETDKVKTERILPQGVADTMRQLMHGVVTSGTGVQANVDTFAAGKTGTTENYGDAWFVGFTDRYTVAVWVGYPNKTIPMKTEYHGGPVEGGTYPAEIWHDFMTAAIDIYNQRHPNHQLPSEPTTTVPSAPAAPAAPQDTGTQPTSPQPPQPQRGNGGGATGGQRPQQTQPPAGGGGTTGGGGGAGGGGTTGGGGVTGGGGGGGGGPPPGANGRSTGTGAGGTG
jgi:penicillin-binding protein 1A